MDILKRLEKLQKERGWTNYKTAQKAKLSESTVSNIYKRCTMPNIVTLEALCDAFGITLSQFFFDYDKDTVQLPPEVTELFENWVMLSDENRDLVLKLIKQLK